MSDLLSLCKTFETQTLKSFKQAIRKCPDLNFSDKNDENNTALLYMTDTKVEKTITAKVIIAMLLHYGANVNLGNKSESPLIKATGASKKDVSNYILKMLVIFGSHLDYRSGFNDGVALLWASVFVNSTSTINAISSLIIAGTSINKRDICNRTVLLMSVRKLKFANEYATRILLYSGANITLGNTDNDNVLEYVLNNRSFTDDTKNLLINICPNDDLEYFLENFSNKIQEKYKQMILDKYKPKTRKTNKKQK